MREIRKLANGSVKDDFSKVRFLESLPEKVRFVLAASDELLEKIATIGDQMVESVATTPSYSAVLTISAINHDNSTMTFIALLIDKITALTTTVGDLNERLKILENHNLNYRETRDCNTCERSISPSINLRNHSKSRTSVSDGVL